MNSLDISEVRWTKLVIDWMWEVKGSELLGKVCFHRHSSSLGSQILLNYYCFLSFSSRIFPKEYKI